MEAARVLTLRGHKVTIFEKSDHLGGNLVPAGVHDFKCEVASLNEYFRHQMKLMDIDVRLNCEILFINPLFNNLPFFSKYKFRFVKVYFTDVVFRKTESSIKFPHDRPEQSFQSFINGLWSYSECIL